MAITLTEKAAKHITRYIDRRGKGLGLRFGVRTTGCSGLAYKLEYVDEAASIKNAQIAEELALPPVKIHCSILAEDAIKAAVQDYKKKHAN